GKASASTPSCSTPPAISRPSSSGSPSSTGAGPSSPHPRPWATTCWWTSSSRSGPCAGDGAGPEAAGPGGPGSGLACGGQLRLAVGAAPVAGPHGVDHPAGGQAEAGGGLGVAGGAAAQGGAGLVQRPVPRCPMDGAVHPAAARQGLIGSIYHRVDLLGGDVTL